MINIGCSEPDDVFFAVVHVKNINMAGANIWEVFRVFVVITMKELNSYKEIKLEIPAFASISIRAIWLISAIA